MSAFTDLGDNYEINENDDGDLEIVDANNSTTVIRHDNSTGRLIINEDIVNLTVLDSLIDPGGVSHTGELADASDVVDDHGNLAGLGDDDHTQYPLVDGTRGFTGTVDAPGYTVDGDAVAQSVALSGQVQLSSGEATVDTGISATDATFNLALGVDDPGADVDLSGRLFWDDSAGTYKIQIVEATTSVGNPTANYDVVRVR